MVGERREEFETLIGNLKNQVRHLNLMVEQFLAVGKSRSTVVEKFDLATLVEEVVALVRQQILVKNITLEIRIKSNTKCHGDHEQIGLVILNLVLNAVQFSSLGSQIIIDGKGENNNCIVRVRDTGPGIDPAIINKVFEPWVTTREGGVGLGLALCKRVVERHNGTIKAVNNEQGGAIFEFSIPMEF
jgi:signal transduction histidine kinase